MGCGGRAAPAGEATVTEEAATARRKVPSQRDRQETAWPTLPALTLVSYWYLCWVNTSEEPAIGRACRQREAGKAGERIRCRR